MDWVQRTDIQFAPELGLSWFIALGLAAAVVVLLAIWRKMPELLLRAALLLVLCGLLLNSMLREDERQALPDQVLIVVDESESQKTGRRDEAATAALARVQAEIEKLDAGIEPVVLRVAQASDPRSGDSTRLFAAMRDSLMNLPAGQMGGAILITDGQVHDAPAASDLGPLARLAPIHVVLTGRRDEYDRKISVPQAPQYALIGQKVDVDIRVDEEGSDSNAPVVVEVWQDGNVRDRQNVVPGSPTRFSLDIAHPGQNVFEFRVPVADAEMTEVNNVAPVIINGVRDRLRVLLVSGVPHMGERAWRNLLKSDPGIDLVHFTILRPPTAMDATPQNELSLIVFPVDELFHSKIDEFDLIIFDKYQQFNLLQPQYFDNIRAHVRKGGAFLLAMGSDRADDAVFSTALADTLPVSLLGSEVSQVPYRPQVTPAGAAHPMTADLGGANTWGQWQTQAKTTAIRGETLMTGHDGLPLLVVDQVENGRVGVIASDNLWLWSKGGTLAGPYNELLRNLSHWLMKEPELEKDYLKAEARGRVITISQRDGGAGPRNVTMTGPNGASKDIVLDSLRDGWMTASETVDGNGIYAFSAGERKVFVVVGTAQSEEYADIITTDKHLAASVEKTKGGFIWYGDAPEFSLRHVDKDARRLSGDNWLGIRHTESYTVTAVKSRQLIDNPLFLLLALAGLVAVWLVESGRLARRR